MKLGFNTNGLACHRWQEGLALLAETGYRAVGLTLDHHFLDPFARNLSNGMDEARKLLKQLDLAVVVETGARFLLNPRIKHDPTLMSPTPEERARRIDFLIRSIDIACELEAEAVSFWSGTLIENITEDRAFERLADACRPVIDHAESRKMRLAFEPEPGMFIDTMDRYAKLKERLPSPYFGLTLDIGHVHCLKDGYIPDRILEWKDWLWNVHIEDMLPGVHDHLRFGEGTIEFPPIISALKSIDYQGCLNVELSRHSHMAPQVLRESYDFLSGLIQQA